MPDVTLYTAPTPNGFPISIALEELGVDYDFKSLSFAKGEQKEASFLKVNPNGRIPAIVDHKNGDFPVFETSAILLWLGQQYDPEHKISYDPAKEPKLYSETVQWIMFAHGGLGPMQGQANHFFRYAPTKIEYGIKRYQDETKRLYSVLEDRLSQSDFLVGNRYGLADIKTFPWVQSGPWAGVNLTDFPKVEAWLKRCQERPATHKGLGVPVRVDLEERLRNADKIAAEAQKSFGFGGDKAKS